MFYKQRKEEKFDSFAEISSDEEENTSVLESLRRAPAGSNVQNQLARGNVGDASNEPTSDLFLRMSGPRSHICSDKDAEGGQNVVRSSENVQQFDEYSLSQPTSNKRNISGTKDSSTECSVWNKKTHYCEMNLNESRCQPLDLSIRGASYKTDGIRDGEINSCQKTQSSTSASSEEYSSSALSSSKTKGQRKKHGHLKRYHSEHKEKCPVCDVYFYSKESLQSHQCKNCSNVLSVLSY
ncbi:hypothetical protein CEXT_236571 [Caerostris extrusa]|uniref:C2H2-type domain-containing protein n=1 Tax=Caerostris extrusa TaxID=172846 RepID=A0AAV4UKX7_CAEEX|nr:hypothetical protein CEXT_236571 [Caerostris extrusa]